MWFSRLDLLAFGKFTNVQLNLDRGFNLVFGPNEAGKTTTLRAIRQLLFGFDERTADDFVHKKPNLRVGGIVCNRAGMQLEVIRRKSRNDSLRAADDTTVIDPLQWDQMLCGIDEKTFRQRYGIDYEQLTAGGHQIAVGTGDLGEILFATGSGVMDLNSVKKRLTDEAAEIFKPLGKKQRLNVFLSEWQQKNDDVRVRQLPFSKWEDAHRLKCQIEAELHQFQTKLLEFETESSRLQRWQQAIPRAKEYDTLQESMASLKDVPRLPSDFGAKRQNGLLLLKEGEGYASSAAQSIRTAEQELAALSLSDDLLGRSDVISKLMAESGSSQKAIRDRHHLKQEQDEHVRLMEQILSSIGRTGSESLSVEVTLERGFQTQLATLGNQLAIVTQSQRDAQAQRKRLGEQTQELRGALSKLPPEQSLSHMKTVLRTIQGEGDLESRLMETRTEVATLQLEIEQQLTQLGSARSGLETLASLKLPESEIVKQFERDFQTNQNEHSLARSLIARHDVEIQTLQQEINQLRVEFQVPTEADLQEARQTRDVAWQQIRDSLLSGALPNAGSLQSFEELVTHADTVADRLRQEADRVAQLADALSDLQETQNQLHQSLDRLTQLEDVRSELEKQWQSYWPATVQPVPSPAEMPYWLAGRETLLKNHDLLRRRRIEVEAMEQRIRVNVKLLSDLLRSEPEKTSPRSAATDSEPSQFGSRPSLTSPQTPQLSFGWDEAAEASDSSPGRERSDWAAVSPNLKQLLLQAEGELSRAEELQSSRRKIMDSLSRAEMDLAGLDEREQELESKLTQWRTQWHGAMALLQLPPETTPDAATKHLEILNQFADHQRQAKQLASRIKGIDDDIERFEADVHSLCSEIAPDLLSAATHEAVRTLHERLVACQREATIRSSQLKKIEQAHTQRKEAVRLRSQAHALTVELCRIAGFAPPAPGATDQESADLLQETLHQLESIERSSRACNEHREKLERVEEILIQLASGQDLNEFLSEVRQQSPEDLANRLNEIETGTKHANAERDRLNVQLGATNLQLKQMEAGTGAVEAEETRHQYLAQIRSDAEDYIRLKLASTVLRVAIESYREKTRAPVLKIAGEFFRELTLDSFTGLRVEEDASGKPLLVGCKADSTQTVPVDGMSEGTCDQLYLALRLASLQLEVEPRKDLPLIIDDILIQFDDARSTAALRLLARIAQQRQIIFFTHHEHLLDIVRQHLASECHIHRLGV
ncbi:AAA family ATPase [Schlesneria sp. T3-172]|uniref:AAA family ATPase n=1 Tax=Schlesneria sphaerica TaxID=3373610 RepID=UPI0037C64845